MERSSEEKDFLQLAHTAVIELARVREILRREFPDLAHNKYADAQHNPNKVSQYYKEVFAEARKQGLIRAPSLEESA